MAFPLFAFLPATSSPTSAPSPFALTPLHSHYHHLHTHTATLPLRKDECPWLTVVIPHFVFSTSPLPFMPKIQTGSKWTSYHGWFVTHQLASPLSSLPTAFTKLSCCVSLNVWIKSLCVCMDLCLSFVRASCMKCYYCSASLLKEPHTQDGCDEEERGSGMQSASCLVRTSVCSVTWFTLEHETHRATKESLKRRLLDFIHTKGQTYR